MKSFAVSVVLGIVLGVMVLFLVAISNPSRAEVKFAHGAWVYIEDSRDPGLSTRGSAPDSPGDEDDEDDDDEDDDGKGKGKKKGKDKGKGKKKGHYK